MPFTAFHGISVYNSKLWIDSRICFSVSSTILSCCKDIDAIAFYLFAEEWAKVFVVLNQVDLAAQKFLQILRSQNIIEEFGWHDYK